MKEIEVQGYRVRLWGESRWAGPMIWINCFSEGQAASIGAALAETCALACVWKKEGETDYSPWRADAVFAGQEPFAGGGSQYLKILTERIVPETEALLSFSVTDRGIAGYSLAGLLALHSMYQTKLFHRFASISGSLWFDGWEEYAMTQPVQPEKACIYLSLGDREKRTRNRRMALVEDCTRRLASYWGQSQEVVWETNSGGHFTDPVGRMAKGIRRLLTME